jgi:hypothetical protein
MTVNTKGLAAAIVVAVASVGGYWYYSPYLAIKSMHRAAQAKDADVFNDYVDYPKLRESFKGQFSAMVAEKMGTTTDSTNGFAAMGAALGLAMANQMIEAMVRPETIMRVMQDGKVAPRLGTSSSDTTQQEPVWHYVRKGVNKLIAYPGKDGPVSTSVEKQSGLVFQRSGFADWKLTEVRLPGS